MHACMNTLVVWRWEDGQASQKKNITTTIVCVCKDWKKKKFGKCLLSMLYTGFFFQKPKKKNSDNKMRAACVFLDRKKKQQMLKKNSRAFLSAVVVVG